MHTVRRRRDIPTSSRKLSSTGCTAPIEMVPLRISIAARIPMTMFCSSVYYPASPVPDRLVPELTGVVAGYAMLRWQASCIENPAVKPDQT
jgi:hypothetical protein